MKVIATHLIPDGIESMRIDRYLPGVWPQIPTRSSALKAGKRGLLLLDGQKVEPSRFIRGGQEIALLEDPQTIPPTFNFPIPILYEDEEMALIHKPPGLPVSGNRHKTVEHALPANLTPSTAPDALRWPRPVHRLDVRTQGVLVVAKTASAIAFLSKEFEERRVQKTYEAVVLGALEGEGTIDTPIEGRPSKSRYQALQTVKSLHVDALTWVRLWPETGRTHQLRIHLSQLGHPILGDDLHTHAGPILRGNGLFLAAVALAIRHPDGQIIEAKIDTPQKFHTHMAREARRWTKFRAQKTQTAAQ